MSSQMTLLPDRGVVQITGPDAVKFLDGMTTNDLAALQPGKAVHAGLLNPQGKILFEFIVYKSAEALLLDTSRAAASDLVKRLGFYKLRAAVTITDLSEGMAVAACWDATAPDVPAGILFAADPRHAGLGYRLLMPAARISELGLPSASDAAYHARRIRLSVPEAARDYQLGDTFPHEANFDVLGGVSFAKGCYVGQEVVSRMQNKAVVRKRVVRVSGTALVSGAAITHGDGVIGTVGSVDVDEGLAMLRLDRALEARQHDIPLLTGGQPVTVSPDALATYERAVANRPRIEL